MELPQLSLELSTGVALTAICLFAALLAVITPLSSPPRDVNDG